MKSPFPGMDPYLEAHWLDVHSSLVIEARNALNDRLPSDLAASSEERVSVESVDEDRETRFYPDVRVFEPGGGVKAVTMEVDSAFAPTALAAPIVLRARLEPMTERFIRITDSSGERLIAVIEFVSPANKIGRGLKDFRDKRKLLLSGGVSFVEIDLCRTGDWKRLLEPFVCPEKQITPYRAVIRLPGDLTTAYLFPIPLRESLPSIPIPLRAKDPEVRLELQPLIDRAYANGRYARRIDYRRPLDSPLEGDDAAWAHALVANVPPPADRK